MERAGQNGNKNSKQKGTIGKRRMIQTSTKIKYIKKQKREEKIE